MNILADASLPGLSEAFPKPFCLSLYHNHQEISALLPQQDILLCRSTLKVNQSLLKDHRLSYVATASSGTDHLDHQWLLAQNIQIIDAKGSNASSVADYVVACLAYLDQQQMIQGKKAGIIGFGKVGTQVAARLQAHGFQIITYDPLKELRELKSFKSCSLQELYHVDLLCIHAELQDNTPYPSKNLIDKQFLEQLKSGCILINAARGDIVNEAEFLTQSNKLIYCTDVYSNEPVINQEIINQAILCTPHIAGHSLEAKYRAVTMVSEILHELVGLPTPQFATPEMKHNIIIDLHKTWQENALKLYNPLIETLELKKAKELTTAFLKIRKNHYRHNFALYADTKMSEQIRLLLGDIINSSRSY